MPRAKSTRRRRRGENVVRGARDGTRRSARALGIEDSSDGAGCYEVALELEDRVRLDLMELDRRPQIRERGGFESLTKSSAPSPRACARARFPPPRPVATRAHSNLASSRHRSRKRGRLAPGLDADRRRPVEVADTGRIHPP
jgi:hypothetical protein